MLKLPTADDLEAERAAQPGRSRLLFGGLLPWLWSRRPPKPVGEPSLIF
jgi:hypothetical protein